MCETEKAVSYNKRKEGKQTMKQSKKAIYAAHGIEYKNGKILYNGTWISELLKEGNSKTGKKVYTWSMLPGKAGTCACDCVGCYAQTGFYNMPSVIESLTLNTYIVENDIDFFYNAICAQLETIGSGEIRIHAAGDFNTKNSKEYANCWKMIALKYNTFLFWTYTKVKEYETLFDGIENANIVKSVINGIGYNFGHCDYIINTYNTLKNHGASVYICRCGIDKNQHCENCKHCATTDFVLFIEHSTEYKAEKDPLFETLKAIIDAQ